MTHRRARRRLGCRAAAVFALLGATAVAAPQASGPERGDDADRTRLRELIDRLGADADRYGAPSPQRLITGPEAEVPERRRRQPVIDDPAAARIETLKERARRRAYDGAPPVIPHSRNFVSRRTCLDCHVKGFWLGQRFGPPLSHPQLTNCTQCHVESANLAFPAPADRLDNGFTGRLASRGGVRASTVAPPVMPHSTMMRTRCLSCHGPRSRAGLRTGHPERMNCTQCHAVAASLDQSSPFFTGNATLLLDPVAPEVESGP